LRNLIEQFTTNYNKSYTGGHFAVVFTTLSTYLLMLEEEIDFSERGQRNVEFV
jgi:hypothetical protein